MPVLYGFRYGVNLGNWFCECGDKKEEHYDSYIKEEDFCRIASWGADHVRIPFAYYLFERDDSPFHYEEAGLARLDGAIALAKKHGLNVVLDLHYAPGFHYSRGKLNDLFTNGEKSERFLAIWKYLAKRYEKEGEGLAFELLNEMVWESDGPWDELWQKAVSAIHAITPERKVIVGGNCANSIEMLRTLPVVNDPHVIYTFHMYEPFIFTHQRASWIERTRLYKKQVPYPFFWDDFKDYYGEEIIRGMRPGHTVDGEFIRTFFDPAVDFIKKYGRPLYLGEYGVIPNADEDSAVNWLNDVANVCNEWGIGRAVWSYRGFSGLTDREGKDNRRVLAAVFRK